MGWYSNGRQGHRKEYIQELIDTSNSEPGTKVLAHCYRGGVFSGVLWSVWKPPTGAAIIRCDMLEARQGVWWHKPFCEGDHPYSFSCPLKYLDMAPVVKPVWREMVRAKAEETKARAANSRRRRAFSRSQP